MFEEYMANFIVKSTYYGTIFLIFQFLIVTTTFTQTYAKAFEGFQDLQIAPIARKLLEKEPHLLYGGAKIFDMDNGWLGIGVGIVDLPQNTFEISNTRKIATAKATEALIQTFSGSKIYTEMRSSERYDTVKEKYEQKQVSSTTEEIKGTMPQIQTVGSWKTDKGLAIVVLTGTQILSQADLTIQGKKIELYNANIERGWQEVILQAPWVLEGGVTLCKYEGKINLLVVESTKTSSDASYNAIQLPVLMDTKARKAVVAFLKGVDTHHRNTSEIITKTSLNDMELTETMKTISRLNSSGFVINIKNIGKWLSSDKKRTYFAYAVPLAE